MMVELATLQAISYIMGSLGVFLAAIYYIFNMRATHQARKEVNKAQEEQRERDEINKKIQLTNNMLQTLCKLETQQISGELLNYTWNDTQDFLNKYDSSVNPDSFAKRMALFNIFETLGYLLKQEVIDEELINGCCFVRNKVFSKLGPFLNKNDGGEKRQHQILR